MPRTLFNDFDFMALRKPAMLLSAVLLLVSVISLITLKLNVGIDFTGGTLIEVSYPTAPEISQVRANLSEAGLDDAAIDRLPPDPDP